MAPNFNFFLVSLWLFLCAVRVSTLDQNIFSIDKEAASIWQSLSTAINTKSWSLAKEKHSELLNLLTLSSTPDAEMSSQVKQALWKGIAMSASHLEQNNQLENIKLGIDIPKIPHWCSEQPSDSYCIALFHLQVYEYGFAIKHLYASVSNPKVGQVVSMLIPKVYEWASQSSSDTKVAELALPHITEAIHLSSQSMDNVSYWHHLYKRPIKGNEVSDVCEETAHWWDNTDELHQLNMGHWPEPRSNDMKTSKSLYGSVDAQKAIYKSQHPISSCSETKYLVVKQGQYMTGHGIGSLIHSLASSLALALSSGRVLIYDSNDGLAFATDASTQSEGVPMSKNEFKCGDMTSFECFFKPISKCTFHDAITLTQGQVDFLLPSQANVEDSRKVLLTTGEAYKEVPSVILDSVIGLEDHVTDLWLWWKAQAVSYLMRPNQATRVELQRRRQSVFPLSELPRGVVSTHVRHGDKGLEMQLVPVKDYLSAAELLLSECTSQEQNKAVFVSTEDPSAITGAMEWTHAREWELLFTDIPRQNLPLLGLVSAFGGVNEMLNGLLNLQLAVECDYWICTLSSNWCGLIDELRSTSTGKAHMPYVDIGFPCFQGC